jgi:hypothetical protein
MTHPVVISDASQPPRVRAESSANANIGRQRPQYPGWWAHDVDAVRENRAPLVPYDLGLFFLSPLERKKTPDIPTATPSWTVDREGRRLFFR